ncbi:hypothetical protein HJFPF1_04428 [Paramyrothecium foliicola]|nr:hypothetical protein HJFPF1_04428 [Paramyrothecium foliicola]
MDFAAPPATVRRIKDFAEGAILEVARIETAIPYQLTCSPVADYSPIHSLWRAVPDTYVENKFYFRHVGAFSGEWYPVPLFGVVITTFSSDVYISTFGPSTPDRNRTIDYRGNLSLELVFTKQAIIDACQGRADYFRGISEATLGNEYTNIFNTPQAGGHRLVHILPANNPSSSLCKVVTSGMALGYPSPVVVNWGQDYRDKHLGGPHLTKITGALEYLDAMSHEKANEEDKLAEHDLVVLVDAYDVWWQLPPEVLIRRYHEINEAANQRLAQEWGSENDIPMKQTIVASTQKKCWPTSDMPSQLHCDSLPESPARPDLYGEATDTPPEKSTNEKGEFHDVRPRYLNSGTIIGPVGDMRRYLRRVQDRMYRTLATYPDLWSDQGVFAEILGEQEIWRTQLRKVRKDGLWGNNEEVLDMASSQFEYHVGLDYAQQLFIATVFEEDDGDIFALNNQTYIAERSKQLGIEPVRLTGLPDDIKQTENPLKRIGDKASQVTLDWGELPLYADFYSEAIPVAVHHNAHRDGLKGRRVWWWDRMWFFPDLRAFVETYLATPLTWQPLASLSVEGSEVTYWALPSEKHKRKPRLFKREDAAQGLDEVDLGVLCQDNDSAADGNKAWFEETFRDGKGPL